MFLPDKEELIAKIRELLLQSGIAADCRRHRKVHGAATCCHDLHCASCGPLRKRT
jgi:hypothetical protein